MSEVEGEKIKVKKKRKVPVKAPSFRMKKLAVAMVAKGSKSLAQEMKKVGYSENTARAPSKITRSQSWQALMDQYLPQDLIARKHSELLEAEDVVFIPRGKKILEKRRPDHMARRAGIEMAHKLRGNFAPEKIEVSKRKFQEMSNAELAAFIEKAKKTLIKK